MRIEVYQVPKDRIEQIYAAFKAEVNRIKANKKKVIVPEVTIQTPNQKLKFTNVEVRPHREQTDKSNRENDTEDIWAICEGADYLRHMWEFVVGDFDSDDDTDFTDFCILAESWLGTDGSFWCGEGCDLTHDGDAGYDNLKVLGENWLTGVR